jgi:hypothetical protein
MVSLFLPRLTVIAALCVLLLPPLLQAATVTATLDRSTISEPDTVLLSLQTEDQDQSLSPDLTPLDADFEVLSNSQRSQIYMVNGKTTATRSWEITLAPKRSGALTVPALSLGSAQTQPLHLTVTPASANNSGEAAKDQALFLEATLEPGSAYVQSQLLYRLRLYTRHPLRGGSLTPPAPAHAKVQKLGDDSHYQTERQGQQYEVYEQRYAVFPEQSGTLTVPPVSFEGQVAAPQTRSNRNFPSLFDDLYANQGRTVRLRSPAAEATIQPKPADFPGEGWLPATSLTLSEQWPQDPPQFKVGEPVTRTLSLTATGLLAEQLPSLPLPQSPALKHYTEQPTLENRLQELEIQGLRRENQVLVPTQPGSLELPEIRIPWWDVKQQQVRYAVLPARRVEVAAAAAQAVPAAVPVPPPSAVPAQTVTVNTPGFWPWLSLSLGLGWLLTLGLVWRQRRPVAAKVTAPLAESPSLRAAYQAVQQACEQQQPQATNQALLAWARARWPQASVTTLGELAARLSTPAVTATLQQLERQLYYPAETSSWAGTAAWQILAPVLRNPLTVRPAQSSALPPLYPVTSH